MQENKTTNWAQGLPIIQYQKNTRFHSGIGRSPYEAVYGKKPKCGLQSLNLPQSIIDQVNSEEDLLNILETNENENESVHVDKAMDNDETFVTMSETEVNNFAVNNNIQSNNQEIITIPQETNLLTQESTIIPVHQEVISPCDLQQSLSMVLQDTPLVRQENHIVRQETLVVPVT